MEFQFPVPESSVPRIVPSEAAAIITFHYATSSTLIAARLSYIASFGDKLITFRELGQWIAAFYKQQQINF